MHILRKIFYWFTPYVNAEERRVATMFAGLQESDGTYATDDKLTRFIQHDVAVLNLWAEYKYKGYKYLTKATRRKLYENLAKIRTDFEAFTALHPLSQDAVVAHVAQVSANTVLARSQPEKLAYLASIMAYLRPSRGLYTYHASSSFGRLLQDPTRHKLEGDCNQIVTLYIYLYSPRYDVHDLKLVTYPGHVALQFQGVDVEATNGTFMQCKREDLAVVPVREIVSINLLDTSDEYFQTHTVSAENFLPAARMAYLTSSERKLVARNLEVAYNNAVKELLEQKRFGQALKYAQQSRSEKLVETVGHNGAIHYMKSDNFVRARHFAAYTKSAASLQKVINHNEAAHYYSSGKYHEAITAFRRAGEEDMVKRCYERLFVKEQDMLKNVRTVADLKAHSATVHRMRDYALKSGNSRLIEHANKLAKQVG